MKDILLKIFGGSAGEVTNRISNVVDKFVRTKDEKAAFEKEMTQILIEAEAAMQKNVTEKIHDAYIDLVDESDNILDDGGGEELKN